jgi:hypothetical protein
MTTAIAPDAITLDSIIAELNRYHQRATYAAGAGLLTSSPRSLMVGRDRNPESSWVVRREGGQPTGYSAEQKHPALTEREHVISSPDELRAWLRDPS